ncbi:MAG: serine protein kinase RIO, partial [Betaproteobacteria bacterium HGW-Betaproteobacteria-21]
LVDSNGPVIIDLPQAVDAAANNNASRMLDRDVDNLATYFGQFAPELLETAYGKEIWSLYESGKLHPEIELTGVFHADETEADLDEVMQVIDAARKEEAARRARMEGIEIEEE